MLTRKTTTKTTSSLATTKITTPIRPARGRRNKKKRVSTIELVSKSFVQTLAHGVSSVLIRVFMYKNNMEKYQDFALTKFWNLIFMVNSIIIFTGSVSILKKKLVIQTLAVLREKFEKTCSHSNSNDSYETIQRK